MRHRCWLVKQEPSEYSWSTLIQERTVAWTGVRNFLARNHLRAMSLGDWVLFYHSGQEKAVVGLARVRRTAYPDPTTNAGDWSAVDLEAVCGLTTPISLSVIKQDRLLQTMLWVRQSRLSVSPLDLDQFRRMLELSQTSLPKPRT